MFAELGRRADAALDAVGDGVHATVVHVRRAVGAVATAATRVKRETQDLAWDYQDVAADLRKGREVAVQPDRVEGPEQSRPRLRVVGSDD